MRENIVILKSEAASVGCVGLSGLSPVTALDAGNFRFLPQLFRYICYVYIRICKCLYVRILRERERERQLLHE